ncbi:pyridoxamine 5'-phosphate oxidase [Herbidospora sp. NBRC 101105]|nr:pyridoxamine 5'-phosphate oxidase [Herbidospora sp. NBRC 101105]
MAGMATWQEIENDAPEFAARFLRLFDAGKHKTMATLRRDGSPRISGTETQFTQGELWLGSMTKAVKAADLLRDGRMALHGPTADPGEEGSGTWPGEAKLSGRAVEVTDPLVVKSVVGGEPGESHLFRVEIEGAVITRVEDAMLVIESWAPGRGVSVVRRR